MSEQMGGGSMGEVTSDDKLWAMLAYLFAPISPIVIMLFMPDKKERPYIKANNMQALILGIVTYVSMSFCIGFLVLIYQLYCAFQAYNGKPVAIPVITDLVKNQGWA